MAVTFKEILVYLESPESSYHSLNESCKEGYHRLREINKESGI